MAMPLTLMERIPQPLMCASRLVLSLLLTLHSCILGESVIRAECDQHFLRSVRNFYLYELQRNTWMLLEGSRFTITAQWNSSRTNHCSGSLTAQQVESRCGNIERRTGTLYIDGVQVAQNTRMTFKPSDLALTTAKFIGQSAIDRG